MKSALRLFATTICLILLSGCATSLPSTAHYPPPEPVAYPATIVSGDVLEIGFYRSNRLESESYTIGVGDVLRVEVDFRPELTSEQVVVLPDGRISLSLIGSVVAAGRTVEELAAKLEAAYRAREISNPEVVVSLQAANQRTEQFLDAVAQEDGGNQLAFRIHEGQELALPFLPPVPVLGRPLADVRQDIEDRYSGIFGNRLETAVNLRERPDQVVYVMGEVQKPGPVTLTPGGNPLTVLAAAGGLQNSANDEQILVVRFREDGSYYHWFINLDETLRAPGQVAAAPPLRRNDVIYVAKSDIAEVNTFVEQYIRGVLPFPLGLGISIPVF